MFSLFRPENPVKCPFPDFAIFRTEGCRGGFRWPSRAIRNGFSPPLKSIRNASLENCTLPCFLAWIRLYAVVRIQVCRPFCHISSQPLPYCLLNPCEAHLCTAFPLVSGSRDIHHGRKAKDVGILWMNFEKKHYFFSKFSCQFRFLCVIFAPKLVWQFCAFVLVAGWTHKYPRPASAVIHGILRRKLRCVCWN